ncbi:hypothetical protein BA953_21900 [Vibrio coralliilyticus]|uniref:hypothetical protein n=1 Tax=Vibrio coralliilyticus TaxID=190893 RepID=UPI0008109CC4|nr:hypothetical protein [Vibrio coralliilyticus]ANW26795.1 hypothetical protein BA953_21900 [Vibrio coralliilyticus]
MARFGKCQISNLKLKPSSKRAIRDIKEIINTGTLLSGALAATPFYQIFGTPSVTSSPVETLITIREHDWDTFIKVMSGAEKYTRNKVFMVAYDQEIFTYGDEKKFWNCISEATK